VGANDGLEQSVRLKPLPDVDLVTGIAQKVETAWRDRLGH
jgi:hypothetical protein